jgi:DNA-binding NtrC family response regulator
MKANVLIIEDNASLASSLKRAMELDGYEVRTAANASEGLTASKSTALDVVVTDLQLAGPKGLEATAGLTLIGEMHTAQPHLPVILMTAHHTTQIAIEATKLGAYDYILKPFETQALLDLVSQAIESKRLMSETVELGSAEPDTEAIVGNSRAMQNVYKEIGRVATRPVTVLIRGETGTGKELVSRAIFQHSDRAGKPFIIVNCAAIPETLLESELFGHEQGAFTGATVRRIGRFEQANGGTIFLDEIGDMSMSTQAKLLRVLQDKTIQRLGGKETIPVDVRVLAATHRDLEAAIRDKQFREYLYFRLNDASIVVPPLRDRREDIVPLVDYFLQRYGEQFGTVSSSMTAEARDFLREQAWPGNVRELENVVRKALLSAHGFAISVETVRTAIEKTRLLKPANDQTLAGYVTELLTAATRGEMENVSDALIEAAERELYAQAIKLAVGNQAKAAKWLGVSRPTMREKLKSYGLRSLPEGSSTGIDI